MIERIHWADVAKGIGIILVVLGHAGVSDKTLCFIFSFHMPLFFFISGLFLNINQSILCFTKKRVKQLLIPYAMLFFVSVFLNYYFAFINESRYLFGLNNLKEFLFAYRNHISDNTPLWFLPTLFLTEFYVFGLKKIIKRDYITIPAIIMLSFWVEYKLHMIYVGSSFFWNFDYAIYYAGFYICGYFLEKYIIEKKIPNIEYKLITLGGGTIDYVSKSRCVFEKNC